MSEGNVNSDEREISLFVMEVIDTGVGKNNCLEWLRAKINFFFCFLSQIFITAYHCHFDNCKVMIKKFLLEEQVFFNMISALGSEQGM